MKSLKYYYFLRLYFILSLLFRHGIIFFNFGYIFQCVQMMSRMEVAYISPYENETYRKRNITVGTACSCMYRETGSVISFLSFPIPLE